MNKVCTKCHTSKHLTEFFRQAKARDGHRTACKSCSSTAQQAYCTKNKEKLKKRQRARYVSNLEENRKQARIRMAKTTAARKAAGVTATPEQKKAKAEWQKAKRKTPEHREWRAKYRKARRENDPVYLLCARLRSRIRTALVARGYSTTSRTKEIIGMEYAVLKEHLETQYQVKYNKEVEWQAVHVDHIIPISSAKTEQELLSLNHWTNLQLLDIADNLAKSDKRY